MTGRAGLVSAWRMAAVFGSLSFLQGVVEPTEGLLAQPVRARLLGWGHGAGAVGGFAAVLGLPWAFKPLLGVLSDALPLWGSRRRGYLVASGGLGVLAFLVLAVVPRAAGSSTGLLVGLLMVSVGVAMADVVTDALAVDRGRLDGRTARYQSSQWFCLYASGVVTGTLGGAISAGGHSRAGFLACALASVSMTAVAWFGVRESPTGPRVVGGIKEAAGSSKVWAVAGFLALEGFNPLNSGSLLQAHMTGVLGLSEQAFGHTVSALAVSSMAAAAVYGVWGRRVSLRRLAWASVALSVFGNVAYLGMNGTGSAMILTSVAGFVSILATLVQFEIAATACPPTAAGTVFAAFMAVSNLSASLAVWSAGVWYDAVGASEGKPAAFRVLVLGGAATSALGALLVPCLPVERANRDVEGRRDPTDL